MSREEAFCTAPGKTAAGLTGGRVWGLPPPPPSPPQGRAPFPSCRWSLTVSPELEQLSRTGAGWQDLPTAQGEVVCRVVVERPEEAPRVGQELLGQQDRHTQERPLEADLQAGL